MKYSECSVNGVQRGPIWYNEDKGVHMGKIPCACASVNFDPS
jgi:hypothetical protein